MTRGQVGSIVPNAQQPASQSRRSQFAVASNTRVPPSLYDHRSTAGSPSLAAAVKPSDNPKDTGCKRREDHRRKPLLVRHRHGTKARGCCSKDQKLKISRTHSHPRANAAFSCTAALEG